MALWRVETRRALEADASIGTLHETHVQWTADVLARAAGILNQRERVDIEPCLRLVKEAAALAAEMRLSPVRYDFFECLHWDDEGAFDKLFPDEEKGMSAIDALTGRRIRSFGKLEKNGIGSVGTKLCNVSYGIKRRGADGQDVFLEKATMLVKFGPPMAL